MKRKTSIHYIFLISFFVGTCCIIYAQHNPVYEIDSLKGVLKNQHDDTNKVNILNKLSAKFSAFSDYDSSLSYAKNAQTLAEKIGFKNGTAMALKYVGNAYTNKGNYPLALEYHLKSLAICEETGNQKGISAAFGNIANVYYYEGNYAKALEYNSKTLSIDEGIGNKQSISDDQGNIGSVYYSMGNYPKALEYNFKALSIIQEIGYKKGALFRLGNIGNVYHEQGNYSKAIEYYLKALSIAEELGNKNGIARNLGNIGVTYGEKHNYPKALEYDFNALAIREEIGNKEGTVINLDNIGNIYYDEGNYSKANNYNTKALSIVREIGDKDLLSAIYIDAGKIFTKQKNFKQAKIVLDSALQLSRIIGSKEYIENSYAALAMLDSATGNYKTGWKDYIQSVAYHDSTINKDGIKKIAQLEASYEFQRREDSIRAVQEKSDIIKTSEINRRDIIIIGVIIILLLIVFLAIALINKEQIKHKKDKVIFEKEKQQMEDELEKANLTLNDYVRNMMEKNELLEQFKMDIENLKILKSREINEERIGTLEHLNKTTILTDEDWNKFKNLFSQVHQGFFVRLKDKLPELTQAEIRLLCLTKLKIDSKQMGGILGVSTESIRTSRYRLRKKLGLSEENRIDDVVNTI